MSKRPSKKKPLPVKPNDYGAMVDYLEGHIGVMKHMAHYLVADLEFDFDHNRGEVDEHGNITLRFRVENIDATVWMIGELWCRLTNLDRTLQDFAGASAKHEKAAV